MAFSPRERVLLAYVGSSGHKGTTGVGHIWSHCKETVLLPLVSQDNGGSPVMFSYEV